MVKRWEVKKTDTKIVKKLAQDLGVSEIIATLLVLRGITKFDITCLSHEAINNSMKNNSVILSFRNQLFNL